MQNKKFNHNYEDGTPLGIGDRYYAQDLSRDNRYLQTLALRGLSAIYGTDSGILNGLQLTKKSESLLGLTAGIGYCHCAVTIVDDDQPWIVPPKTKTEDILGLVDIETRDIQITPEMKNGNKHYVKAKYKEKIIQSRTRQASGGSYGYVVADSYEIKIDEIAPTKYEVLLGTFQGTDAITVTGEKPIPSKIPDGIQEDLNKHIAKTTEVHGATSAPTANKIAIRDGSGRFKVSDPSDDLDVANKQTVKRIVVSCINDLAVQSWTTVNIIKESISRTYSLIYGNNVFLALADQAIGAYSEDGVNWTSISNMNPKTSQANAVCYGNYKFICVDNNNIGSYCENNNFNDWKPISDLGLGSNEDGTAIIYAKNKFIVGSSNGKGAYSENGTSWSSVNLNISASKITKFACGNDNIVAVSSNGSCSYSKDGLTWTQTDIKLGNNYIYDVTYGNGKFVAVSTNGNCSYSEDGVNWTKVNISFAKNNTIYSIAYGNGKFVAGIKGFGVYSEDGVNWSDIYNMNTTPNVFIQAIAYGDGKFVVFDYEGKGAYSLNLIS